MGPAEDVQRQIAIAPVVAMEEAALLRAMDAVVGSIEVQDQLLGHLQVPVEEDLDEKSIHGLGIEHDTAVAVLLGFSGQSPLEPMQRALARQRLAAVSRLAPSRSGRVVLAGQYRQQPILDRKSGAEGE